jgi:CMP-N-acetylneuraminic acid synthetase
VNNICIIPARAGSQRIPGKNIKEFAGVPIIVHSIMLARSSNLFDEIIVSTDGDEIAKVAREWGVSIHWRHPDEARDEVGTQTVAKVVLDACYAETFPWATCVLYATAPLLTMDEFMTGYEKILGGMIYAMSVDENCNDVGGFYWGWTYAFLEEVPLEGNSIYVKTNDIDINTPDDWEKAEELWRQHGYPEDLGG